MTRTETSALKPIPSDADFRFDLTFEKISRSLNFQAASVV